MMAMKPRIGAYLTVEAPTIGEQQTQARIRVTSIAHLAISHESDANFTLSCDGEFSPGNPYPCCGSGGNCTYWAWEMARQQWNRNLRRWGNARDWADAAQRDGFVVNSSPAVGSMAVNSTSANGLAHVAWVADVRGTQVTVSEMSCGSYGVQSLVTRPVTFLTRALLCMPHMPPFQTLW
jgi:hypothetical protein